ncbi:F-box/RNI-like superfamily protein [Thalictrum thalictroides]|uniref:F-box/RNI-like superfamily protein n=1 Tax=Thalictrum thalictroides TaxID=46969 RepID=A0A7J6V165_THATH|nr:F-box/RNI-like superfamily protein [Thalictrum thalictroides]
MSYLPDPIRSHIVSFLPMKDAMRTSILSKQWQNICSSLSQLEFDQSDFTVAADFKDFVDEMLIRHDGSDIKRFSLKTSLHDVSIPSVVSAHGSLLLYDTMSKIWSCG